MGTGFSAEPRRRGDEFHSDSSPPVYINSNPNNNESTMKRTFSFNVRAIREVDTSVDDQQRAFVWRTSSLNPGTVNMFPPDAIERYKDYDWILLSVNIENRQTEAPPATELAYQPIVMIRHSNTLFDRDRLDIEPIPPSSSGINAMGSVTCYTCGIDYGACKLVGNKKHIISQMSIPASATAASAPTTSKAKTATAPVNKDVKTYFKNHGGLMFRANSFVHHIICLWRDQLESFNGMDGEPLDTNIYMCDKVYSDFRCVHIDTMSKLRTLMEQKWFDRYSPINPSKCVVSLQDVNHTPAPPTAAAAAEDSDDIHRRRPLKRFDDSDDHDDNDDIVGQFHTGEFASTGFNVSFMLECRILLIPKRTHDMNSNTGDGMDDVLPYLTLQDL